MSNLKISLGILQRISEFLADLPEDQLADLADGRARLAYIPVGSDAPVAPKKTTRGRGGSNARQVAPPQETTDLLRRLETFDSREAVQVELAPLKKTALQDLAKVLSVPRAGSLGADALRLEIVQATVGRRLDSIAIRGFDGLRP